MNKIYVESNDQYGLISIEKDNEDSLYCMTYYSPAFYNKQPSFCHTIWNRVKNAWIVLTGKDYRLFDIVLTQEEVESFSFNLDNLIKDDIDAKKGQTNSGL